ncbi:maltose alpha-D-glucosyltransferase [Pararobbsia alpina]|uniref:maltose alpha-D-glucosyltransferase n=1 Tax=Pararobbsia alpina TaxID=621374 RepID=A0A6S7B3P7_9BURK|nr:maltose alpha-D-glucosyltransferase [Pararobbsia alpina]CAB3786027.1 Glucosamine kinase [Pararobbsia alpina]
MKRNYVSLLKDDPVWYKDAIIYQVHIKSFFDSNNDGIGDFPGLIAKLDYIAELGVDVIWLLPFYPSPRRDDGYDIADYRSVHADYGTIADFRKFVQEAHLRGIRVITELVINHTSDQHPWFQRARHAKKGSHHRNYYVWSDDDQKYANTRIIFIDSEPSNWTHDPVAGQYYWHRFFNHQPDLNFDNPQVLKEVLSVMRFWLDLGVDGLRLDAVPYLVEREGTSNENLPETHEVLKKIRATLEGEYPNRLLLAEANQWPEDVQDYFGKGDECHMAFHFPLMPRIYMAIATEDRFPIIDIMRQTPEIPDNCQWAIFLRNHDELTLEMVTDSERDYLWNTYASDRRARLNLGIRRRLAPLLERDRRRIELINSLLLSMPGTPVIYYGDEIGMGDNIHLGDRDGVRTPMQWSSDRNGGFSRADPEQLVLPPVMGSLYGFDSVNVEAQARDPHSLLNWMRRMLATRRSHPAFGRGRTRFLRPANRKILAYLREVDDSAPILCVANLSRSPQAVELDLAEFQGSVPVEMTADSTFPPIGQLTYLLTLPPYGFYWFLMCPSQQLPVWSSKPPEQLPEFATLVVRGYEPLPSAAEHRRVLEHEVLPVYLTKRRWFGSKNSTLKGARLDYVTQLPHDLAGNDRDAPLMFSEVAADVGTGQTEHYFLPLGVTWDSTANPNPLVTQLALARVRRGRNVGFVTDAYSLPGLPATILDALRRKLVMRTPRGDVHFRPTEPFLAIAPEAFGNPPEINWLAAEQSNSSLIANDVAVLKIVRRVVPGIHPEAEMTRYLTQAGYPNTGGLFGEVVRITHDGTPHTLAILQSFIDNQGDAWSWVLDYLRRFVNELAITISPEAEGPTGENYDEAIAGYAAIASTIGQRLGELHVVLARPTDDPAFAPEVATPENVAEWIDDTQALLSSALNVVEEKIDTLTPDVQLIARTLLDQRGALLGAIETMLPTEVEALRTRIHGDFHLGQILVAQGDVFLIDFEGEPARTLEQRRRKTSPLRDVAGLLRSFSYANAAAAPVSEDAPQQTAERKRALFERLRAAAREAFLASYRKAVAASPQRIVSPAAETALLDLFLIEKASYEVCYEAANRPTWLSLPIRGLASVAARVLGLAHTMPAPRTEHPSWQESMEGHDE